MGSPESAEPSRYFAQFAAFVALFVGLFVLSGWAFDMEQLTNIVPAWPKMVKLTALSFVLAGVTLWLATVDARVPAMIAAALLTAIGLTMLYRDATGWDIYLEQLTFAPLPISEDGHIPPGMAMATAASFALLGLSLCFAQLPRTAVLHQVLAVMSLLLGWLGLSRYVFGGEPLVRVHQHGGAHRNPVPAAFRRRAYAAPGCRRGAPACEQWRRRWHGATTAAGRDRGAAAGRRTHDSHRAPRHVRLRGRGFDICAVEHHRVHGLRDGSTPRAENAPTRCVAPPNVGCASRRSATSSSSKPHSTA